MRIQNKQRGPEVEKNMYLVITFDYMYSEKKVFVILDQPSKCHDSKETLVFEFFFSNPRVSSFFLLLSFTSFNEMKVKKIIKATT